MPLFGKALEYFARLEDGLDDMVFTVLASKHPGTLIPVAVVEAGFERITMKAVNMNEAVINEFIDYTKRGEPLQKLPLRDAFRHLDHKHGSRLSGTTSWSAGRMWASAEAEKFCLLPAW